MFSSNPTAVPDGENGEPLQIGQSVAHYRITAAIGAGGMGEVYRATDTRLHRAVALKVLPPEMAASPERLQRFQREARAVAALNDPHVVTIYSVEEADGVHFLTMELVEGEPLDRLIPATGMAVTRLLDIAAGIADALVAAHDKGIVHRDLKPANVMLTKAERVKVLDFGLAKMSGADESPPARDEATELRTREGVVMGTMPYMSPEQLHGQAVDHRTDIFSLGVMLYERRGERDLPLARLQTGSHLKYKKVPSRTGRSWGRNQSLESSCAPRPHVWRPWTPRFLYFRCDPLM